MAGAAVLTLGFWEAFTNLSAGYDSSAALWLVVAGTAVAVPAVRRLPWLSFGLLWALLVLQVATTTDVMIVQLATALVAFGLARWGRRRCSGAPGPPCPW